MRESENVFKTQAAMHSLQDEVKMTGRESVDEFFNRNAEGYARSMSHARGNDLALMISRLGSSKKMKALDVATGTGFTAIELSGYVDEVFATDRTRGMLDQAKKLSEERGIARMHFIMSDSTALPFSDAYFDIVTCRRAAHHFRNKDIFLAEVHRCLASEGFLAIVDMVAPEGFKDMYNSLERARDSSHEEAETFNGWKRLVESNGFELTSADLEEERVSFDKWLYPVNVDTDGGRNSRRLLSESDKPFRESISYDAGSDAFVKRRMVAIARRS